MAADADGDAGAIEEDLFAEEAGSLRLELRDVDVVEWVAGAVGGLRGGLEALPARGWTD